MGIKSPEELQSAARMKLKKDMHKGSAARGSQGIQKALTEGGEGTTSVSGDEFGRHQRMADPRAQAKATVRAAKLAKGEIPNETPPMRGKPSHQQYRYKCEREKLEYMVTWDGWMIYHPAYDIAPFELSREDTKKLGINYEDFDKRGLGVYNDASYDDEGVLVLKPGDATQETPMDEVNIPKEDFQALMKRMEDLEAENKANASNTTPPKRWNGQVSKLINEGLLYESQVLVRWEELEEKRTLNKADVQDLIREPAIAEGNNGQESEA